jgi:hypothetical protein
MRLGHSVWFNDTDGFQNLADTQINLQERDRQADDESTDRHREALKATRVNLLMSPRYNIKLCLSMNRITHTHKIEMKKKSRP